jgi:hypothetical protein
MESFGKRCADAMDNVRIEKTAWVTRLKHMRPARFETAPQDFRYIPAH